MSARSSFALALTVLVLAAPLAAQDRGTRPPPGGHHGPPPEALAACTSHVQGASCTFTGRGGETLTGTCGAPSGLPLACMPAGGPPHGPHGGPPTPPPEALSACADIAAGDACVVDTPHGTLEGTCRATPSGTACAPAHGPGTPGPDGASDAP